MATINGTSGNDTLNGTAGDDEIYTGTGVDTVSAGAGNDRIYSQSTGGTVDGGDGYDYYQGDFTGSSAPLSVTVGNTIQVSNGITISNVENARISTGSGDDLFTVS